MPADSYKFRPKARILRLLGDQLIGNSRLAIFELTKNAYDADAENVSITLSSLGAEDALITVRDDGDGMDEKVIRDIWFVPGADHREKQRQSGRRSATFHRLPLGEKGLGRFAVHKLGDHIQLVTRSRNESVERVVDIDWEKLLDDRFLDSLEIVVEERNPTEFVGAEHGTLIRISKLRQRTWSRGDLRRLYRQVTSICSPFVATKEFTVELNLPGREQDLAGLPSVAEILEYAFWHFTFDLDENGFSWTYKFTNRLSGIDLENRLATGSGELLVLDDSSEEAAEEAIPQAHKRKSGKQKVAVDEEFLRGIGPLSGEFFVFDRDKDVLEKMGESELLTKYLNENGGVRVYRDAIRVYNYGERGDDWLGLDLRRVNQPTRRISRNNIVGAINTSLSSSDSLIEKTNREGFVENEAYSRLRRIVLAALTALEAERDPDRERLRKALGGGSEPSERFDAAPPIEALRREARRVGAADALEPYIERIQREFNALRDTLLHAGMSGVGLAVVFHEIDRGVRELYSALRGGMSRGALEEKAKDLSMLLDGFSTLLRRSDKNDMAASTLLRQARDVSSARFRFHKVRLVCPILENGLGDFHANMARGLMLGALTNLIDNALYWLRVRWPDEDASSSERRIYMGTSTNMESGPAIIIADNGPGFKDGADLLTKPFYTRRPDGMGLGLYYVKLAMDLSGGSLQFPLVEDLNLPEEFDGAAVALVFNGSTLGS